MPDSAVSRSSCYNIADFARTARLHLFTEPAGNNHWPLPVLNDIPSSFRRRTHEISARASFFQHPRERESMDNLFLSEVIGSF
jgi:hypothetical protein